MRALVIAASLLGLLSLGSPAASPAQFAAGTSFSLPPPPNTPTSTCYGCGGGGSRSGGGQAQRPASAPTNRDYADPQFDAGKAALSAYRTTHSTEDYNNAESHLKATLSYIPGWGPAEESLCELYGDAKQYEQALAACQVAAGRSKDFEDKRFVKNWLVAQHIPWIYIQIHTKTYVAGVASYEAECGGSANTALNNGITVLEDGGKDVVDLRADSEAQVDKCKQTLAGLLAQSKALNDEVALWNKKYPR